MTVVMREHDSRQGLSLHPSESIDVDHAKSSLQYSRRNIEFERAIYDDPPSRLEKLNFRGDSTTDEVGPEGGGKMNATLPPKVKYICH